MRALLLIAFLLLLSAAWAGILAPGMGLRGVYYSRPDFTGAAVSRYGTVDLSWSAEDGPLPEMKPATFSAGWQGYLFSTLWTLYRYHWVKSAPFSARWQGYVLPAYSETYTFTVTSSGGVRLIVNDQRLVNDWTPHPAKADSGTITLPAGKLAAISLQTTQPAGAGTVKLQWSSKSQPLGVIPVTREYPPLFAPAQLIYSESADPHASTLYITELDGTPKKLTVAGSSQPALSPNGKQVIFSTVANQTYSSSSITRVGVEGTGLTPLTRPGGEKLDPAYSADGLSIAYILKTAGAWQLWTMRADGGRRTQVLENPLEIRHPQFTPDGKYLIYQAWNNGQPDIFRVTLDGTEVTPLTTQGGSEAAINRRGDLVVFVSARGGIPQLFTMKPDGKEQAQLLTTAGTVSQPFFDRSGTQIGYLERDAKGKTDLFMLDLADRIPCRVTDSGKFLAAVMTPIYRMIGGENLVLWLNALSAGNLELDEQQRVASWSSLSIGGFVAAQPNGGERPVYHPDALNGFPTVYFPGNARLFVPDISAGWGSNEGTLVILFRPDDCGQYSIVNQDNCGDNYWRYGGDGDAYIGIFSPIRFEHYPNAMPTNGVHVLSLVGGAQFTAYLDGVAKPPQDFHFQVPTTLTLGTGGGGGNYKGDIAELAIFNRALSNEERQAVEDKFMALYGVNK